MIFLGPGIGALSFNAGAQLLPDGGLPEQQEAEPQAGQLLEESRTELAELEATLAELQQRVSTADTRVDEIRSRLASGADVAGVAGIMIDELSLHDLDDLFFAEQKILAQERARIVELDSNLSNLLQATTQNVELTAKPGESERMATTAEDSQADADG
jgi:predicted  nucleic acid-binding Zn-ribbon protein